MGLRACPSPEPLNLIGRVACLCHGVYVLFVRAETTKYMCRQSIIVMKPDADRDHVGARRTCTMDFVTGYVTSYNKPSLLILGSKIVTLTFLKIVFLKSERNVVSKKDNSTRSHSTFF